MTFALMVGPIRPLTCGAAVASTLTATAAKQIGCYCGFVFASGDTTATATIGWTIGADTTVKAGFASKRSGNRQMVQSLHGNVLQ